MIFRHLLPVVCAGLFSVTPAWADAAADKKSSREIVDRMAAEFREGKLDLILARTHPGLVKELGGREKFEKITRDAVVGFAEQGVKVTEYSTGEPDEPVTRNGHTFILIPTRLVMVVQKSRVTSSGWMLCIRAGEGADWHMLRLDRELTLDKLKEIEPNIPDDFVMPEIGNPKVEPLEDEGAGDAGKKKPDGKKPKKAPDKVKPA